MADERADAGCASDAERSMVPYSSVSDLHLIAVEKIGHQLPRNRAPNKRDMGISNLKAYANIQFTSFHPRHTFRGWILAEVLNLLTHSSTPDIWMDEGKAFCLC